MKALYGRLIAALLLSVVVGGCGPTVIDPGEGGPFAPGVDLRQAPADQIAAGHQLIAAGEHELAIRAFNRAALSKGRLDAEILSGLGTANLALGRLSQAEDLLRRATEEDDAWPEIWNNYGVVLMERGKTAEAVQIFRKAFALDDGESTQIRDNLRLALAKFENSDSLPANNNNYKLVRRGSSEFVLRPAT